MDDEKEDTGLTPENILGLGMEMFVKKFMEDPDMCNQYPAKDLRMSCAYNKWAEKYAEACATEGSGGNTYVPGTGGGKKKKDKHQEPQEPLPAMPLNETPDAELVGASPENPAVPDAGYGWDYKK